jgi:fatty acid omega-hydroxylase
MDDFFGHGIFNANGKEWRYQRKTASNIFNIASFRDLFTEYVHCIRNRIYAFELMFFFFFFFLKRVFVDQLKIMSDVLDQKENQVVDLHEMFYKFTLDSFIW